MNRNQAPLINRSSTKVLFFLFIFTLILFIFAFRWADRTGLIVTFTILCALYLVVFFFPPSFLQERFPVSALEGHDAWGINAFLKELFAPLREIPPQVLVFDSDSVNAFISFRPFFPTQIYISRALLEKLSADEIRAALAMMSSRVMHQDGFKEALIALIRQTVEGLGENVDQIFKTKFLSPLLNPISRLLGKILFSEK